MDYEYRFTVGMSSVDAAGVMFFPELLRHTHDAYESFMKSLGHELRQVLATGDYLLPIRHAEADYIFPMFLGAEFVAHVQVARIGKTSFRIATRFVESNEQVSAHSETTHVCVDTATGRPTTVPDALRHGLQAYRVEKSD